MRFCGDSLSCSLNGKISWTKLQFIKSSLSKQPPNSPSGSLLQQTKLQLIIVNSKSVMKQLNFNHPCCRTNLYKELNTFVFPRDTFVLTSTLKHMHQLCIFSCYDEGHQTLHPSTAAPALLSCLRTHCAPASQTVSPRLL